FNVGHSYPLMGMEATLDKIKHTMKKEKEQAITYKIEIFYRKPLRKKSLYNQSTIIRRIQ
ncbi:hypothetical protein PJP10_31795, partial [Mycobacterium kansasii]